MSFFLLSGMLHSCILFLPALYLLLQLIMVNSLEEMGKGKEREICPDAEQLKQVGRWTGGQVTYLPNKGTCLICTKVIRRWQGYH